MLRGCVAGECAHVGGAAFSLTIRYNDRTVKNMTQKNVLVVLGLLVVGAMLFSLGVKFGGGDDDDHERLYEESYQHAGEMGAMMDSMTVSNDKEFIESMIPHHQEAIDTAQEVLERGGEIPEIRTLAQNIIAAQEREIASMKSWYEEWFGSEYQDTGTYVPMMRELAPYSGEELDIVFSRDMIMHHMGAIMMARQALNFSERTEIINLAQSIIDTQGNEIQLMRSVLSQTAE